LKNLIVSVLVSAIITAGGLWYYDRHYATHIAVFDMNGYLQGLKRDFVAGKLPRDELQKRIAELKTLVGTHSPNTITLLKEVVLSGKVQELGTDTHSSGDKVPPPPVQSQQKAK